MKRKAKPAILFLLLFLLAGCQAKQPPIVLIIIDTLRYDHVGADGYARKISPSLDLFARDAVRFEDAQAAASWTVPSMASLFTGVYPWDHGVVAAEVGNRSIKNQQVLSEQFVTLAETLKKAGYATWGVSANYHMHPQYGMEQGFEKYQVFRFCARDLVDKQLKSWLPQIALQWSKGQPYFLYVHYFDPHHPYLPVHPFIDQIHPNLNPEEAYKEGLEEQGHLLLSYYLKNPDKMQMLVDLYDSEIQGVDESVGRLLDKLPGGDQAVVLITADHGEAFGEHQNMLHGTDLYEETLHVPLLVRLPHKNYAGTVNKNLTSLIDLYPTLATLARAKSPNYLRGMDLNQHWSGAPYKKNRRLFAMVERQPNAHWQCVLDQSYKLAERENPHQSELYDRRADPSEKINIIFKKSEVSNALKKELEQARPAKLMHNPGVTNRPMDKDLQKQLKGLGYL